MRVKIRDDFIICYYYKLKIVIIRTSIKLIKIKILI